MALKVDIIPPVLPSAFASGRVRQIIQAETKRAVNESLVVVRNRMAEISPRGATNVLKGSWQITPAKVITIRNEIVGEVFSGLPGATRSPVQANVIENGARPHFPPAGPLPPAGGQPALGTWIRRKLGITDEREIKRAAFAIGRSIQRRGLPRRQSMKGIFGRTFLALRTAIVVIHSRVKDRVVKRLG